MIRQATKADLPALTDLALLLWPDHTVQGMADDLVALMAQGAAFFLAERDGAAVGFAEVNRIICFAKTI